MKRLILCGIYGMPLIQSGLANLIVPMFFRFVWGALPSQDELASYLGARSARQKPGTHWSGFIPRPADAEGRAALALADFCAGYDEVELWFDPSPNDQIQLTWLLDHFRSHPEVSGRLYLRLMDDSLHRVEPENLEAAVSYFPRRKLKPQQIEAAGRVWQAYGAPTPQACIDVFRTDLSAFPLLRPALFDLLLELPGRTGLGATELRILELVAAGINRTNALFHLRGFRQRGVYGEFEMGSLLGPLAHGPMPVLSGLDKELRTLAETNLRDRHTAYLRSRLSITDFGRAVLAHQEDFSRHNPIDRWWGGTHLTNDKLWRFDSVLQAS